MNKAWPDDWKKVSICRDCSVATTKQAAEAPIVCNDTTSHIADLAGKGALWPLLQMTTKCMTSIFLRSHQKELTN